MVGRCYFILSNEEAPLPLCLPVAGSRFGAVPCPELMPKAHLVAGRCAKHVALVDNLNKRNGQRLVILCAYERLG